MKRLIRMLGLGACLGLLSGCFQVQLMGPVGGARIKVTDLREPNTVLARTVSNSRAALLAQHGANKWENFGPVGRLFHLGVFHLDLNELDPDRLYLVTATGGKETDYDRDGKEDAPYTTVNGEWHAIMTGAQLQGRGMISALTEAAYQWLLPHVDEMDDRQLLGNLDAFAQRVVDDVNDDGTVDYADVLRWSRLFDQDAYRGDQHSLDRLSLALVEGNTDVYEGQQNLLTQIPVLPCAPWCGFYSSSELEQHLAGLTFDDFMAEAYRALLLRTPQTLIELGIEDDYAAWPLALDDISDLATAQTTAQAKVIRQTLDTYDTAALTPTQQRSHAIFRWYLDDLDAGSAFPLHNYPASAFITGIPNQTEFFFSDIHPLQSVQDAEDYLVRLRQVGKRFETLQVMVAARASAGIIEPRVTLNLAIDGMRDVSNANAAATPYFRRFSETLADIPNLASEDVNELRQQARQIIEDSIQPAYAAVVVELLALRDDAPEAIGVGQFNDGDAFYQWALRHHTGTELSPTEIHQLGLEQLERVHSEIRSAAAELGYSDNLSLSDLFNQVAQDSGLLSGNAILDQYEELVEAAHERLPEAFSLLPELPVVVIGGPSGGYYVGPSLDGVRPGAFYAATQGQEPYYLMPSLSYHEAEPGHHLQIALARELDNPDFQRHTNFTGFVEGWGLYAERLAYDLGWYQNDAYGNLGRLQFEAIRAARLAVDTGIHQLGWSFDEATDFYARNAGVSTGNAQGNVARFLRWPGQATAYMVGLLHILELRDQFGGVNGDLHDFHARLLGGGAVPLELLDKAWLDAMVPPAG